MSKSFTVHERIDQGLPYHVDLLHRLGEHGHFAAFADKSLHDLGMNVRRVAAYMKSETADAWVVSAASREILEWFAAQPTPAFAKFGWSQGLPLAGMRIDKIPAIKIALGRLHALGHRRIVLMVRQEGIKPHLGPFEQAFINELNALGIMTGPYNLPDWGDPKQCRGMLPRQHPRALRLENRQVAAKGQNSANHLV